MPTTCPSTHEVLEFVRKAYLDEAAADTVNVLGQLAGRDKLVMCLRAEVVALDKALREERERRQELELGLRSWRLARETLEALEAGSVNQDTAHEVAKEDEWVEAEGR